MEASSAPNERKSVFFDSRQTHQSSSSSRKIQALHRRSSDLRSVSAFPKDFDDFSFCGLDARSNLVFCYSFF